MARVILGHNPAGKGQKPIRSKIMRENWSERLNMDELLLTILKRENQLIFGGIAQLSEHFESIVDALNQQWIVQVDEPTDQWMKKWWIKMTKI